ncbi:MAG: HEAT repeat domain-containing protein, partial [Planctomycetes bacterium]|nr:HEAT repeat domain-containing protein [Planctomycetota bacterium]
ASENEAVRRIASRIVADISFNRYVSAFDKLDNHTREVAGKAVLDLDHEVIHKLAAELQAIDPAKRLKAVRIIEATGSAVQVQDAVLALVNDPDKKVRATIINLLAAMKNTHAIKALVRLLSDKDTRVQANVLEALEEINRPEFRQLIVPFLKSPNNRVRANACHALWHLGVHKVARFMFEMLESANSKMRLSGAWVIGETKPEDGVKALTDALAKESVLEIKTAIRRAIKRFDEAAGAIESEGGEG